MNNFVDAMTFTSCAIIKGISFLPGAIRHLIALRSILYQYFSALTIAIIYICLYTSICVIIFHDLIQK